MFREEKNMEFNFPLTNLSIYVMEIGKEKREKKRKKVGEKRSRRRKKHQNNLFESLPN